MNAALESVKGDGCVYCRIFGLLFDNLTRASPPLSVDGRGMFAQACL